MNILTFSAQKTVNLDAGLRLIELSSCFTYPLALRAAVELKLAECLKEGTKSIEQLSKETNADAKIICKILRLLATQHIFKSIDETHFALTPDAELLLADHPYSLRQAILMITDKTLVMPLCNLSGITRGERVFDNLFGNSFFGYWEEHANQTNNFHNGMSSMSRLENEYVVKSYDFPKNQVIADIAGGYGSLLLAVLKRNPTLTGILFDKEHVLKNNVLHLLGDDSRWSTYPGSFFEKCPEADIYLLKYISHDWPDEKVVEILKTIRRAMKKTSKLLLIDCIMTAEDKPYFGKNMDLLCTCLSSDGGEHTLLEFEYLFSQSELKLNQVISTNSYNYIIEVLPA